MNRAEAEKLLEERTRLRAARDFAAADEVREHLREGGWEVLDSGAGSELQEVAPPPPAREVTFLTLVHGWPDDVRRWLSSVQAHPPARDWEVLLVDNSGDPDTRSHLAALVGDRVRIEVVEPAQGWAGAANRGLEAAAGELVVLFDPGTEVEGDLQPLFDAMADERVAVAGPFGVRSDGGLHDFAEARGREAHAIEGYCLALRRAEALAAGGFDKKFRFYRIADFELSFRLRSAGAREARVVDVPVRKHAHRLWEATEPEERDRLSKRNFYRMLDLWRGRPDLVSE